MKNKIRLLAAVLAVVVFASCGGSASAAPVSSAPAASAPAASSESEVRVDITGTWDDRDYYNEWTKMSFTLPEGWYALTAEQIAQLVGGGVEFIAEDFGMEVDDFSAQISETDYYDFYTTNAEGMAFFWLDIFNRQAAGVPSITSQEYLQQLRAGFESLSSIDYECGEIAEDTLQGNSGYSMDATLSLDGEVVAIQSYFVQEKDEYLLMYAVSANNEAGAQQIEDLLAQIG